MQKDNSLLKAGAVLAVSSIIVKLLSAIYRIPLTRMLGPYAMGKYSIIFNLFMPFFALATAGVAPAISRMSAQIAQENPRLSIGTLEKKAIKLYIVISSIMVIGFIGTGYIYSKTMGEAVIFIGAIILAPNIIFATIEAVYKGSTQGQMDMLTTAKANIVEGVSKTVIGLCLVMYTIKQYSKNQDYAIIAGLFAITASGIICWIYLKIICKSKSKAEIGITAAKFSYKGMLKMSVPIAMSAVVISLINFFDTAVCVPIIRSIPSDILINSFKGASFKGAGEIGMFLFGTYQGMTMTVFNLIPALMSSIGTAGLPIITKSQFSTNREVFNRQVGRLFYITSALSVPICVFTYFYAQGIMGVLFNLQSQQGIIAYKLLKQMIISGVFASFIFVLNSILHSFEKSGKIFNVLLIASVIKCILSVVCCSIPNINIRGLVISSNVFYIIVFMLSIIEIRKLNVEFKIFKIFFIPLVGAYIAITITRIISSKILFCMPLTVDVIMSGVIFSLFYLLVLILTGFLVEI